MKGFIKIHTVKFVGLVVLLAGMASATFDRLTYPAYRAWQEAYVLENELLRIRNGSVSENSFASMQSYVMKNTFAGKSEQLQQYLFSSLSSFCDSGSITLNDFSAPDDNTQTESVRIVTTKVTVEGEFKQILKLIYLLETSLHGSNVTHTTFYLSNHPQDRSQKLNCDVYIQSIVKGE